MAQLLDEIEWGQAILPRISDPAWEAEVKRRAGQVSEVDRRVASSPWVREVCVSMTSYRPVAMPQRLFNIGALVTAQENSCRYCYGANRAYMKVLGYSESFISRIERDATFAELDEKERAFIAFCRSLARSRPRPVKADYEALVALGFRAACRQRNGDADRVGVLLQSDRHPDRLSPEHAFERVANGFLGRLIGPLMRMVMSMRQSAQPATLDAATLSDGPFGTIVAALQDCRGHDLQDSAGWCVRLCRAAEISEGADVRGRSAHARLSHERIRSAKTARCGGFQRRRD